MSARDTRKASLEFCKHYTGAFSIVIRLTVDEGAPTFFSIFMRC